MKKTVFPLTAAVLCIVSAAFADDVEETAPGFPAWTGFEESNFIMGREISGPYLRHRITAVIEIDFDKAAEQLAMVNGNFGKSETMSVSHGMTENEFVNLKMPRDYLTVVSVRGNDKEMAKTLKEIFRDPKYRNTGLSHQLSIFYKNAGIANAPDTEGKRPYIYVMGVTGEKPIYQSPLRNAKIAELRKAVKSSLETAKPWRDFFGSVEEPKYTDDLIKLLENEKPLRQIAQSFRKKVTVKNAEAAAEYQIVADAIEQTKLDTVLKIHLGTRYWPWYTIPQLKKATKLWPEIKKYEAIVNVEKTIKSFGGDIHVLYKAYQLVRKYSDPEYTPRNAGEVKKAVQQMKKALSQLESLKNSKQIVIQNGAVILSPELESLIQTLPNRVKSK